jgi:hypothetical protein
VSVSRPPTIAASLDIFGNKRDVDSRADVEALDALTPAMSCASHNKWRVRPSRFPIVKTKYSLYINDKWRLIAPMQ